MAWHYRTIRPLRAIKSLLPAASLFVWSLRVFPHTKSINRPFGQCVRIGILYILSYLGICQGLGASTDAPIDTQGFYREFIKNCPRPEWWEQVQAPHVETHAEFQKQWMRYSTRRENFKMAYQAVLDHPKDVDIL